MLIEKLTNSHEIKNSTPSEITTSSNDTNANLNYTIHSIMKKPEIPKHRTVRWEIFNSKGIQLIKILFPEIRAVA